MSDASTYAVHRVLFFWGLSLLLSLNGALANESISKEQIDRAFKGLDDLDTARDQLEIKIRENIDQQLCITFAHCKENSEGVMLFRSGDGRYWFRHDGKIMPGPN